MKSKHNLKMGSHLMRSHYSLGFVTVLISVFMLIGFQSPIQAQEGNFSRASWWFGVAGGANFNFYRGSTHQLTADFAPPATFHNGTGAGLYLAPLVEYHRANSVLGVMLQGGYDSRKGSFDEVKTPCNCPADLSTDLSYITIEPSLRIAPFKNNFYFYAGPRFAFVYANSFTYKLGVNPDYPEQAHTPNVTADFSDVQKTQISMQVGMGYDIPISPKDRRTQLVLSPFISYQPYFGQAPRSIETWNITTLRVGAALKIGRGHKNSMPIVGTEKPVIKPRNEAVPVPVKPVAPGSIVKFSVFVPPSIPSERIVREIFPIRNYIFFDIGSTVIPERYVLLEKDQVKNFKEEQVELFTPKNLSGRSDRQLIVYYNLLNILGDRMGKNPAVTITLVGSSENGPEDGLAMAESVKHYLVDIFGIGASRIKTEGREKPKIPSVQPGQTEDLELLIQGDRRVSVESSSPVMLMEFQSGPEASLKPVEVVSVREAPVESYVIFDVERGKDVDKTWSLEIEGEDGIVQYYGPYTRNYVSIPCKTILKSRNEGDYNVTMVGKMEDGSTIKRDTNIHLVLWTPTKAEEVMEFSVIYEFNSSDAILMYEKYLNEVVIPKIPAGAKVIIYGYTDVIGDEDYNQKLSLARANDVKRILESGLAKAGRSDVNFEAYGFGEDPKLSPFDNKYPEERFYNRTVRIDIIPQR